MVVDDPMIARMTRKGRLVVLLHLLDLEIQTIGVAVRRARVRGLQLLLLHSLLRLSRRAGQLIRLRPDGSGCRGGCLCLAGWSDGDDGRRDHGWRHDGSDVLFCGDQGQRENEKGTD